jgi:hypothetical protein
MNELFKKPEDALTFAFNFSSQQYAESQMSKLQSRAIGTGKGLVALDGAGQAGMILAELGKLDPLHRHCIVARFAPKTRDCPCCGGERPAEQWRESIVALSEWSMTTFTGLSHRIVREAIIIKHFGGRISIEELSNQVKTPKRTIYDMRSKILNALKPLDSKAQEDIYSLLIEKAELIEVN